MLLKKKSQADGNVAEASAVPKKSNKKLKVVAAAVAAVLVLGGITAALVVRSIYNKPENVLAIALGDFLLDGEDKNFDTKVTIGFEEAILGISKVSLAGNVQMAGKTTQIDLKVDASIISLSGAIQSNENGNLYVKIDDLPSLIASGAASAYGLTADQASQVQSLDGKWIEIKPEDITALTGQEAGTGTFDKCTEALYAALDNEELADKVDSAYKKNKFLVVKSESTETVDGQDLLKMGVGLDQAKLGAFGQDMAGSEDLSKAVRECGLGGGDPSKDSTEASELKDGQVTVWVNRGKRELVKMEANGDVYDAGNKQGSLGVVVDVKKPKGEIKAPADAVNIMTVLQGFGLDPSMLSGATTQQ